MAPLERLLAIMARLRDPNDGCEWDRAQTFSTIAPYTIEEAYEVADAIERDDMADLRGELGDLLLQVVFHARMAQEAGLFAFDDVAAAICAKLEARHPHIFGAAKHDGQDQTTRWEQIKAAERKAAGAVGALDGIAHTLPAMLRTEKLQKRAARTGFDWPDLQGPADKLAEEVLELAQARPDEKLDEAGDVLFSAVNLVRAHGIAPEEALKAANAKFERRFAEMERLAAQRGLDFTALGPDAQDALWREAKASEARKTA